jgi:hypothetical protein
MQFRSECSGRITGRPSQNLDKSCRPSRNYIGPRLLSVHFWANDDVVNKLVTALRAAFVSEFGEPLFRLIQVW